MPAASTIAVAVLIALQLAACEETDADADADADLDADADADSDADGDADADADADADGDADADADADGDGDRDGGEIELGFDLAVAGRGSERVGEAQLVHGVGELEIGIPVRALAYHRLDWTDSGYTLYFVLAPTADDLNVLYLYCGAAAADSLDYFWHESFSGSMAYEAGTGTCSSEASAVVVEPGLAWLEAEPGPDQLLQGVTVVGPAVSLGGDGGSITIGGEAMEAWPFELVDCSEVCTADPQDGWYEVHMLLVRPSDGDRCYGIVYLFVDGSPTVSFTYGFCLGSLERLPDEELEATWAMDLWLPQGGLAGARAPAGPWDARLGRVLRPSPRLR